ncbi:hypothetical protein JHN63_15115 [Streptomyces sp. MBT65]|uniref:hypothetical protein n=1 Tax=Streptomyces sp. MBT65 TaxID=1488395 RepID=UPI00190AEBEF|nr:hypothetical protein [Streptomyces sp. MBT65]MBK3575118.1 hypothetical protein [Streptomyces sp. MBT65]
MSSDAYIRSTIDPDTRKAACLLRWGPIEALITPENTLATARDLMAAAAHADTDIALLAWCRKQLKADPNTAGHMVLDIRALRTAPTGPGHSALRIESVAGAKTGKPYVNIARGSMKAQLDPDEAREMAGHWIQVAVAAQIDVRLRYALGDQPGLTADDIEQIFERLLAVQR